MEKNKDYFEGILQLRNVNNDVIDFVFDLVDKRENVSITKQTKVVNGYDIYLTSQKFLMRLGKKLKNTFYGEMKVSTKLFTRNRVTGKCVYRVNVLFRMFKYRKGDVVDYKGDKIMIIGMGKKILAKDLKTGKKLTINFGDL